MVALRSAETWNVIMVEKKLCLDYASQNMRQGQPQMKYSSGKHLDLRHQTTRLLDSQIQSLVVRRR